MAESARRLDLQDRFLNSVAVKALLAAGHTAAAERTAVLFTRETGADGAATLFDMQHMWYDRGKGGGGWRLAACATLTSTGQSYAPWSHASFLTLLHTVVDVTRAQCSVAVKYGLIFLPWTAEGGKKLLWHLGWQFTVFLLAGHQLLPLVTLSFPLRPGTRWRRGGRTRPRGRRAQGQRSKSTARSSR